MFRSFSYRPTGVSNSRSGAYAVSDSYRESSKEPTSPFQAPLSPTMGHSRTVIIGGPRAYPVSESSDGVVMLDDMGKTARGGPRRREDIIKEMEVEVSYVAR